MFLTQKNATPGHSGRRERSEHPTVEDAKACFSGNPSRMDFEAAIYVDGEPTWLGLTDETGQLEWRAWKI
jgi:hypothetical protein